VRALTMSLPPCSARQRVEGVASGTALGKRDATSSERNGSQSQGPTTARLVRFADEKERTTAVLGPSLERRSVGDFGVLTNLAETTTELSELLRLTFEGPVDSGARWWNFPRPAAPAPRRCVPAAIPPDAFRVVDAPARIAGNRSELRRV
jgi:hypothetical protein